MNSIGLPMLCLKAFGVPTKPEDLIGQKIRIRADNFQSFSTIQSIGGTLINENTGRLHLYISPIVADVCYEKEDDFLAAAKLERETGKKFTVTHSLTNRYKISHLQYDLSQNKWELEGTLATYGHVLLIHEIKMAALWKKIDPEHPLLDALGKQAHDLMCPINVRRKAEVQRVDSKLP